jgi:MFS family permease
MASPLLLILVVVFLVTAGIGMVWSTLALYATTLGASAAVVGLLIAAFGGARLVVNLPAGLASERFGRNRVMVLGLALLALSSFIAIGVTNLPGLTVCLLLQGVGCSMYVTAALSSVADLSTPEKRVRDMAAYQGAQSIGIAVGPGIGGLSAAAWGYGAPFLLQGLFALLAVVMLSWTAPRAGQGKTAPKASPAKSIRAPLDRTLIAALVLLTYGVFFTRVAANWVLLPLVAKTVLGMTVATIGAMLTGGAIANLAVLPIANTVTRRFGRLTTIVGSSAATILSLVLLADAHSPLLLWIAACLLGASSGLAMPILSTYAIDAAPPGAVGAAMGLLRMVTDLGIVSGPVLTGLVVDRLGLGYPGGIWFSGAVLLVAAATFWAVVRGRPKS